MRAVENSSTRSVRGFYRDHGGVVAGMCEPWSRHKFPHAGNEPLPLEHGRRWRIPGSDKGGCRMVSDPGAIDRHGHHQCRHGRGCGRCAAPHRGGHRVRRLAMGVLYQRGRRPALDVVVDALIFPTVTTSANFFDRASRPCLTCRSIAWRKAFPTFMVSIVLVSVGLGTRVWQVPQ